MIHRETLERHLAAVLAQVQAGQTYVVMDQSRPIAILQPPSLVPPPEAAAVSPLESELSRTCQSLAALYTPTRLAAALGVPDTKFQALMANGVFSDSLFNRFRYLEQLAAVIFASGAKQRGRAWFSAPQRELGGRTPAMVLRGGWQPDSLTCVELLQRIRQHPPFKV